MRQRGVDPLCDAMRRDAAGKLQNSGFERSVGRLSESAGAGRQSEIFGCRAIATRDPAFVVEHQHRFVERLDQRPAVIAIADVAGQASQKVDRGQRQFRPAAMQDIDRLAQRAVLPFAEIADQIGRGDAGQVFGGAWVGSSGHDRYSSWVRGQFCADRVAGPSPLGPIRSTSCVSGARSRSKRINRAGNGPIGLRNCRARGIHGRKSQRKSGWLG